MAGPIAYSLWVDFFEDPTTVEDAWRETTRRDAAPWERRLGRVLDVAGPVPWPLKEELFAQLVGDAAWHDHIYEALKGSAFDVYGQLGRSAPDWLARLALPPDAPGLTELERRLA